MIPEDGANLVEALVLAMEEDDTRFSSWELDFIQSLEEQVEAGRALTETQEEKASQIYEDKVETHE